MKVKEWEEEEDEEVEAEEEDEEEEEEEEEDEEEEDEEEEGRLTLIHPLTHSHAFSLARSSSLAPHFLAKALESIPGPF